MRFYIILSLISCAAVILVVTGLRIPLNPRPQKAIHNTQEPGLTARNGSEENRPELQSRQSSFSINSKNAQAASETESVGGLARGITLEGTAAANAEPSIAPNHVIAPSLSISRIPRTTPATAQPPGGVAPSAISLPRGGEEKSITTYLLDVSPVIPTLGKAQRPIRASEVLPGYALIQPLPAYPEQALRSGMQGSVILHGVIATDGTVKNLRVMEGRHVLALSAIEAVKQWRYAITYVDRVPAELEFIQEFNFSLHPTPRITLPLNRPAGVAGGEAVIQPGPMYPEEALRRGIQGTVVLRAVVGLDGTVKNLRVLEGNALLSQSALNTVSNWRYRPSRLNGVLVERPFVVIVKFRNR